MLQQMAALPRLVCSGVVSLSLLGLSPGVSAEEYMQRGASVEDYQQALSRVVERKRGIVTARQRLEQSAAAAAPTASSTRSQPSSPATAVARHGGGAASPPVIARGADVYTPDQDEDAATSDGVSLYFGYNSAQLTAAAREALGKLGAALRAPEFSDIHWLIEGHTDATGAADYNQRLSEARAAAARQFLIETSGIAQDQLITVGKGEHELYDPRRPGASVNRRVRLRPIGGTAAPRAEQAVD